MLHQHPVRSGQVRRVGKNTGTKPLLSSRAHRKHISSAEAEASPPASLGHKRGNEQRSATWKELFNACRSPPTQITPGSALVLKLDGSLPDRAQPKQGPLARALTLTGITDCFDKAANDPRIAGIVLRIGSIGAGWAKLQELREALHLFQQRTSSSKFTIATLEAAQEKEYFLASACEEVYAIGDGSTISLTGLTVQATFLRDALDKAGVEPQVQRIGEYKSAGDQFLRREMSDAQREQLTALLDDIYSTFVSGIAHSRCKENSEVHSLIDRGVQDVRQLESEGWIDGVLFRDGVRDLLKPRTGGSRSEAPQTSYDKYVRAPASAFGNASKMSSKAVGILHLTGAIQNGSNGRQGSNSVIAAEDTIDQVRKLRKNTQVQAVVIRVDSPGGDAFASELMWREIELLAREKPVVGSMLDVSASGGYFLSMATPYIFASPLTITGSIGVVAGKFNLGGLYSKVGYNKVLISRGRYAEVTADNRPFTEEEAEYQANQAQRLYKQFRDLAARCRGIEPDIMEQKARGRVWSGMRAYEEGLVDQLGGLEDAIEYAKARLGCEDDEEVRRLEFGQLAPDLATVLASRSNIRAAGGVMSIVQGAMQWLRQRKYISEGAMVASDEGELMDIAGVRLAAYGQSEGNGVAFAGGEEQDAL